MRKFHVSAQPTLRPVHSGILPAANAAVVGFDRALQVQRMRQELGLHPTMETEIPVVAGMVEHSHPWER